MGDLTAVYAESDALALAALVRRGEVSAAELVETAIGAIERLDPTLNAVPLKTYELARAAARDPGTGPFAGVPFLLKNVGSMWKGTPCTASMPYLKDFVCPVDSAMAERMRAAGLAVLGRSNVPEGGWCITTEPKLYGATRNPWNPAVTPGGSSGGAAAAVASRMVPIAEASDGGGSIRVPASCCGLVGLKPSRGRITYGPVEADLWFGSIYTLCLTRTVRDTAAFLDATAGTMPGDPYTPPRPDRPFLELIDRTPERLRLAVVTTPPWGEAYGPSVRDAVEGTAKLLQGLGHGVEAIRLSTDLEAAWWAYNDIVAVETARDFTELEPVIGRRVRQDELAPFNWSMLEHAETLSAEDYARSIRAIRRAGQSLARELAPFDAVLTPALTQPPRPVGYFSMEDGDRKRYLARWVDAAFMFAFNMSGLPAIVVPAALTSDNSPIGVQLVGRLGEEATLLSLARQIELERPWIDRRPKVCLA